MHNKSSTNNYNANVSAIEKNTIKKTYFKMIGMLRTYKLRCNIFCSTMFHTNFEKRTIQSIHIDNCNFRLPAKNNKSFFKMIERLQSNLLKNTSYSILIGTFEFRFNDKKSSYELISKQSLRSIKHKNAITTTINV